MIISLHVFIVIVLFAISYIDMREMIIPDSLTLMVAIAALAIAALSQDQEKPLLVLGGFIALVLFEGTRRIMTFLMRREAMGFGDVKLMAAGGIWVGLTQLHLAILISCFSAFLTFLISHIVFGNDLRKRELPFAPFIAFGLVMTQAYKILLF